MFAVGLGSIIHYVI